MKPPQLKSSELEKGAAKAKAEAEKAEAEKKLQEGEGNAEENIDAINRMNKRMVRVTKDHNEDVKKLLRLMGLPVVEGLRSRSSVRRACKAALYLRPPQRIWTLTFGRPRSSGTLRPPSRASSP